MSRQDASRRREDLTDAPSPSLTSDVQPVVARKLRERRHVVGVVGQDVGLLGDALGRLLDALVVGVLQKAQAEAPGGSEEI